MTLINVKPSLVTIQYVTVKLQHLTLSVITLHCITNSKKTSHNFKLGKFILQHVTPFLQYLTCSEMKMTQKIEFTVIATLKIILKHLALLQIFEHVIKMTSQNVTPHAFSQSKLNVSFEETRAERKLVHNKSSYNNFKSKLSTSNMITCNKLEYLTINTKMLRTNVKKQRTSCVCSFLTQLCVNNAMNTKYFNFCKSLKHVLAWAAKFAVCVTRSGKIARFSATFTRFLVNFTHLLGRWCRLSVSVVTARASHRSNVITFFLSAFSSTDFYYTRFVTRLTLNLSDLFHVNSKLSIRQLFCSIIYSVACVRGNVGEVLVFLWDAVDELSMGALKCLTSRTLQFSASIHFVFLIVLSIEIFLRPVIFNYYLIINVIFMIVLSFYSSVILMPLFSPISGFLILSDISIRTL